MKLIQSKKALIQLSASVLLSLSISACQAPEGEEYKVEVNKKYVLKNRLNKTELKIIDSLIKSENIIEIEKAQKKIALQLSPTDQVIDPSKVGKKPTATDNSPKVEGPRILSTEEKLERFVSVLEEWSNDSQNKKYYRTVKIREGQKTFREVLRQNFGKWTKDLPEGLIQYSISALNRDIDIENLSPGQSMRVPKL